MQIKNLEKGLKESVGGAVDFVKNKIEDINEIQNTEAVKKAAEIRDKVGGQVKNILKKKNSADEQTEQKTSMIPTKSALKIIYYLMAADGEIFHGEEEKFDAVGKECDLDFEEMKPDIISECKKCLELAADKTYANALRFGIDDALKDLHETEDMFITPKLLIWDLLVIAYSDEKFNESEKNLIEYVAEKFGVDKGICLEMQNSILTISELEKELSWIKTTDRPYSVIEMHVNEINKRKSVITENAMALISL